MVTANPPLTESEKIEFGSPPVHSGPVESSNSLVIASYNIRYARGPHLITGGLLRKAGLLNSSNRPAVVAKHIKQAAQTFRDAKVLPRIDVLALQEADKRTARAGRKHIADELAKALEMWWVHLPAGIPRGVKPIPRQWWLDFEEPIDLHDPGDTGVALLSRVQFVDVRRIDLPWRECPWRPRLAMAATIPFGSRGLRLFNVHVDPHATANGQLEQLEVLVTETSESNLPTVIVGDFNTLSDRKCIETRTFLEARGFSTPIPTGTATWRGAGLRLHADWIFVRGVRIVRWGVARPLNVSDHWPVWAEVTIDADQQPR